MELLPLAEKFGLPVVMLVVILLAARIWIAAWERIQMERTKVEDKKADSEVKKADAMVSALTSLSGKIDAHHTADLQSHKEMAENGARIESKLDTVLGLTPVHGTERIDDEGDTDPESPHAIERDSIPRAQRAASQPGGHYHVQPGKRRH